MVQRLVIITAIWLLSAATIFSAQSEATEATPAHIEFFEKNVRPLLAERCYECHSGKSKSLKGELRLDGRELAIRGGESGAAIVPGKADESLLVEAVRWDSLQMPPKGKLPEREIATLVKWVEMGAPWPAETDAKTAESTKATIDWQHERQSHWAYQPVNKPPLPQIRNEGWVANEIDRFVLSKLEQQSIAPSTAARMIS